MPKESLELADVRTDTVRDLQSVTVRRPDLSLHKEQKGYTNISQFTARLNTRVGMCCMPAEGDATCGQ